MSACHNLSSHSPLKTVLERIGDTYQAYCNTYKTHAMATTMEAWDNPWIKLLTWSEKNNQL